MFHDNYIDQEFSSYLNRHLTGIIQLKDKIEKISIFFELSEAFSNYACRFYIDIDLHDYDALSQEDKRSVNKFFYNISNSTGSKFVSFIYKPQRSNGTDVDVIKSFIFHYQFAQTLFEGVIKNLLPDKCILKIEPLEAEPFFNYVRSFISTSKYSNDDKRSFEKEYFEITKRRFDFDCYYHNTLLKAATKDIDWKNVITDIEIYNAGGGDISDIRKFVVEKEIPFSISYYKDAISEIRININVLKEKIKTYAPESPYINIRTSNILQLLNNKEQKLILEETTLKKKSETLGIQIGDYIYVEQNYWGNDCQDVGVAKEINLNYTGDIEVKYNILKKDLSESRLPHKSSIGSYISYSLKPEIFKEELNRGSIKIIQQVIRLFKEKGVKNILFKAKKKKK